MSLTRLLLIKLLCWVSTHAIAFDNQSLTYLAICETAIKTNDKITANLMAEKLLDILENNFKGFLEFQLPIGKVNDNTNIYI